MGYMLDSDWLKKILLRSDWLGPSVASFTTEINSIFDDIKKNEPLYAEVSRKEAKFWMEIIFKILNKKVDSLKLQKNAPIEEENEEQGN